jgi:ethanolamine utilization protein EutQ (cupin superfamily)
MKRTKFNTQTPIIKNKIKEWEHILTLEILGAKNFLAVNKTLLKHFGPLMTIYISNLVDKYKYFQGKGTLGKDSSFFLTHSKQSKQTGMSEHQLRKCKKTLKEMGVLKTQMQGIPPKEFYIIHMENLVKESIGIFLKKVEECSFRNLTNNNNNKYNKNKKDNISQNLNQEEEKLNIEEEIVPNKEKVPSKSKVDKVVKLYQKYCPSCPKIIKVTDRRKKAVNARLKEYSLLVIKKVFQEAESSNFLSGRSRAWAGCNFDWLMNENNLIKVLEGKYKNEPSTINRSKNSVKAEEDNPLQKLIRYFPEKVLRDSFLNNCYAPAEKLLKYESASTELMDALLNFNTQIEEKQNKNLTPSLQALLPGSIQLIRNYIIWIGNQSWIDNPDVRMFDIQNGVFNSFRRDQAKEDNQERDALTGKSYVKEQ